MFRLNWAHPCPTKRRRKLRSGDIDEAIKQFQTQTDKISRNWKVYFLDGDAEFYYTLVSIRVFYSLVMGKVAMCTTTWKLFNTHINFILSFSLNYFFAMRYVADLQWHQCGMSVSLLFAFVCRTRTPQCNSFRCKFIRNFTFEFFFFFWFFFWSSSFHFLFHQTDNLSHSLPFTFPFQLITFCAFTSAIKKCRQTALFAKCIEDFEFIAQTAYYVQCARI